MGDKAGAAEGSGIFESLFGGFSNGLSIFTNNPFRRKQEVAAANSNVEGDSKAFGKDGSEQAKADETGAKKAEEAVTDVSSHKTPTESEIVSKSQKKKKEKKNSGDDTFNPESEGQGEGEIQADDGRSKKVKRGEDDISEKKKRRRMEVVDESADQEVDVGSCGTASGVRRKRKQETDDGTLEESIKIEGKESENVEEKQTKKKKQKREVEGDGDGDTQSAPMRRQSERQQKKRLSQETPQWHENASMSGSRSGIKERKIGNGLQEGGIVEDGTTVKAKRLLDSDVVEKRKKKMKLVNELNGVSPRVSDIAETPQLSEAKSTELEANSKRKSEDELEGNYEKKIRGPTGLKEDGGSVSDVNLADSNRKGKRKVGDDEDDDFLGGKSKKRRLTKQQIIDNEAKLRRTIFIGNIPLNVKAKHLSTEFSQYGPVESSRLRSVPVVDVKMPRKAAVITGNLNENRTSLNGYLVFKEEASAQAALAHNMKEFRGKHLRVDLAGSGSSGIEYDRKRSIFVGNLPFDAEDEDVITLFHGDTPELEVEAVRVVRDPQTSAGKGFAFVCFKTKMGAESALDKKDFIMFKNRRLRLERFGYRTSSKQTQVKRATADLSGRKPGGEVGRLSSKKAPASYEGERAGKRKGTSKSRERGASYTPSRTGRRDGLPKRPAVAAKKARALQMKGGAASGPKVSGGNRKRYEDGKKQGIKGKARKASRK